MAKEMNSQDAMKPVDGEAAVLIPAGNMREDVVGSYGWMKKQYWQNKQQGWWSKIPTGTEENKK